MMFPIIRRLGWTVLIAALVAAASAVVAGHWQGGTLPIGPGFAACELPCWGGISPGRTAYGDVTPALTQHIPGLRWHGLDPAIIGFVFDHEQALISGSVTVSDAGRVNALRLGGVSLSVPEMLQRLGTPQCARAIPDRTQPGSYQGLALYWQIDGWQVSTLHMGAGGAAMLAADARFRELRITDERACDAGAPIWSGFGPLWRYDASVRPM